MHPPIPTPISELDKPRLWTTPQSRLAFPITWSSAPLDADWVQTYRIGTTRPYVKLRDILALMERGLNR